MPRVRSKDGQRSQWRSPSNWPTWAIVGVFAALVLAFVAVITLVPGDKPPTAADRPVPTASPTPAPDVRITLPASPRLLVQGDTYTEGYGAKVATHGFAYLLAKRLGWPRLIDGINGTGYVAGGDAGSDQSYLTRARALVAAKAFTPNVIILQGGVNDYRASHLTQQLAVRQLVEFYRRSFPGVQIVMIGPARAYPEAIALGPMDSSLAGVASDLGVPYISPVGDQWFSVGNSERFITDDRTNLTEAGHAYFAQRVFTAFQAVGG